MLVHIDYDLNFSKREDTSMLQLHGKKSAKKKRKIVGRGIGSGMGKTSCRGGKGQTARSGVALAGFEGGQTPLYMRLPKRGFVNYCRLKYDVLNIKDVQQFIKSGKIDAGEDITLDVLKRVGIYSEKAPIKLLSSSCDECSMRIAIEVHAASKVATEKLHAAGGTVRIISRGSRISKSANVIEDHA